MIYEILNGETVINTLVADPEFMAANYPDGNYREVSEPPAPAPTPELRHISVGAFYDRFADQKWPILSSTDPAVQGMIKDTQVRKFIDLDSVQLPYGLDMLIAKGYPVNKNAILNDPIKDSEKP